MAMFKKFKDKPAGLLSHADLRTVKLQRLMVAVMRQSSSEL